MKFEALLILQSLFVLGLVTNTTAADSLRVIYLGNSLTENTQVEWHEALGRSAGKQWKAKSVVGPGWTLSFHRDSLKRGGLSAELMADRADLTLEPGTSGKAAEHFKTFANEKWDAVVLQFFSSPLKRIVTENIDAKKTPYDKPTDIGDLQSAIEIIDVFLKLNPEGTIFLYQNWPDMEEGTVPPPDQLPDWARLPGARVKPAEFPKRDAFDYEHEWLEKKYTAEHPNEPWKDNLRCQDLGYQLMEGLRAHYPELAKQNRLRMIPVGDVFLALHRKMKAGEFPGVKDVGEFYTDRQHIRIGLPRYTAAATFYATLFGNDPNALDWKIYNSFDAYKTKYDTPHYDLNHDKGELFTISPETAKIVNNTIHEVVRLHPYTKGK